ncbi:MAG: hypothetical protein LBN95_11770 [Prevotellaceae bacterium]|jgi:hypothetical protein|nr:hypothetical protein [Prevotellaceae bacterium]
MKKLFTILFFAAFALGQIFAQEENEGVEKTHEFPRLRLGVEAGISTFEGKTVKPAMLRENQSYYPFEDRDFYCGFVLNNRSYKQYYFGVKPEFSLNHNLALAAGLRFLFNKDGFVSDKNYFLWKVDETENSANYVKINNIWQQNFYVGIPVELKIFTSKSDLFVRQYFKVGAQVNFLAVSHTNIDFNNENMEKYSRQINSQIEKPDIFSGYCYIGVGLKIGRMNHPFGSIEIQVPFLVSGKRYSAFSEQSFPFGLGLQTTFFIPVGKTKLGYTYIDD